MSSLRIKSAHELKQMRESRMLGERAASRIERELESAQQAAKERGLAPRAKKSKPEKTPDPSYCTVPPVQPADQLYQALVRRWGRFYSGGEVVWELQPFDDSGVRLDASLVNHRIGLEMDGWQFHGKTLSGFKKDRKKQLLFCRRGWLLFRISNEQVREELDDVLAAVEEAMTYQVRQEVTLRQLPKGWSRIVHSQPQKSS
jgi:hypothetical protein